MGKLMTTREAARVHNVRYRTLLAAIQRGELLATAVGGGEKRIGLYLLEPARVAAWVDYRRRKPPGVRSPGGGPAREQSRQGAPTAAAFSREALPPATGSHHETEPPPGRRPDTREEESP